MFRVSTQGLLQRDRASLWFNDIWKDPGKRSRCIDAATLWRIRADFARWARNLSLSCLSVLLPLLLSPPPFLPFGQTNSPSLCLCPSLTNVKGRSSISVFESVKPVQKVATKLERARSETSRGEWRFVWAKTIEGQWISEATREVGSTTVWGHVYATRLDRFSLKQFTFRGYRGSKIYRSKLCDK